MAINSGLLVAVSIGFTLHYTHDNLTPAALIQLRFTHIYHVLERVIKPAYQRTVRQHYVILVSTVYGSYQPSRESA